MPFFFQFSKNGRREEDGIDPEKCAPINGSTMNRICGAFDDIGRLDFRHAGVPPFNYQMLLDENDVGYDQKIVEIFCSVIQESIACAISSSGFTDLAEKSRRLKTELISEMIAERIESAMPLDQAYVSIVKYLFTENNLIKSSCKQEFWNVFGEIALQKLRNNLTSYRICEKCGAKVPLWAYSHDCVRKTVDMFECISCGKLTVRTNSRQCRCAECQKEYRKIQVRRNVAAMRTKKAS